VAPTKKKYYAVARGRQTGIFSSWFGRGNAEEQVRGFTAARYKGFATVEEARAWLREQQSGQASRQSPARRKPARQQPEQPAAEPPARKEDVVIYTDGGCTNNPGPGGYGAVIIRQGKRREISGGFRHTTNNRMELTACIMALKSVESGLSIVLHSDSRYVVNGITKGWAAKWREQGWMRTKTDAAENFDLWDELLELCQERNVRFVWVRGHAGNPENERCDMLATQAAADNPRTRDSNFESGRTTVTA